MDNRARWISGYSLLSPKTLLFIAVFTVLLFLLPAAAHSANVYVSRDVNTESDLAGCFIDTAVGKPAAFRPSLGLDGRIIYGAILLLLPLALGFFIKKKCRSITSVSVVGVLLLLVSVHADGAPLKKKKPRVTKDKNVINSRFRIVGKNAPKIGPFLGSVSMISATCQIPDPQNT